MWTKIKRFLAAPVFPDDEEKTRVAALLNPLIMTLFVLDVLAVAATFFVFQQKLGSAIAVGIIFLGLLISKLFLQEGRVKLAGILFSFGIWLPVNTILLLAGGRHLIAALDLSLIVVAGLVVGQGFALILLIMSSLFYLVMTIVDAVGIALPTLFPTPLLSNWVVFTFSLVATLVSLRLALRSLHEALARIQTDALEREEQRRHLEQLLAERTLELDRRAAYLGVTKAVADEAAFAQYEPAELLTRLAKVVADQFGFYHVGIFLLDDRREWAVLKAASDVAGQQRVAQGYRVPVGVKELVGRVAAQGQADVRQAVPQNLGDPSASSETYVEAAFPLRVRGVILGVLVVQSAGPYGFTDEDRLVLQTLADQIAVVVDSARLFQQAQETLAAERRAYAESVRRAWRELVQVHPDLAFVSDAGGVNPLSAGEQAAQLVGRPEESAGLTIPLRVRGQLVGVIDARKPDGARWTSEEVNLLQTLTEQLSTALEGAQLYEETQRRAAREQLTREITDKMRSTTSWDDLMQTAIQQMADALGVSRSFVQWLEPETIPLETFEEGFVGGL